jgi:AAA domain
MKIFTLGQAAQYVEDNPVEWVVNDFFRRGSFNLITSLPKIGKSRFARQIASSIATGAPFLGEPTTPGEVLFIHIDEPRPDFILGEFRKHGVKDGVHLCWKAFDRGDVVREIEDALNANPGITTIILDTLASCVRVENFNSYEAKESIKPLAELAERRNVCVIGLHHQNKSNSWDVQESCNGSVILLGEAETTVALFEDRAGRIFMKSKERYARREQTELVWDKRTSTFSKGQTASEKRSDKVEMRIGDTERQIIEYLAANPSATYKDIQARVPGANQHRRSVLQKMVTRGTLTMSGNQRDGYLYSLAQIPVENSAQCAA